MATAEKLIAEGKVIPWTFKDPLIAGSIRARQAKTEVRQRFKTLAAPQTRPEGYLNILDKLDEARNFVVNNKIGTIVIDPMTRAIEHMNRFLQYQTGHGVIEESGWLIYLSNLEEFMNHILPLPVNKIFVFHSRDYMDEDTGRRVQVKPLVSGQMQAKVGSYFAEVWYCYADSTSGETEWKVRTKPASWIDCRTSKPLDEVELAYFPDLIKKGGWGDKPFTVMLFGPFGGGKTSLALSLCDVENEEVPNEVRPS